MKKSIKAGLLIITLVIPALIFAFLQLFGTNHYNLPYFNPQYDTDGSVVIVQGDTVFRKLGLIDLDRHLEKAFSFEGKLTIVNYAPKICQDSCELVHAQLDRAATLTNAIPELHLLTLTDAQEDLPKLSDNSENGNWITMHASAVECREWIEKNLQDSIASPNKVALLDRKGYIRGYYNVIKQLEADRLMAEIKILDYEKKKE